MPTSNEIDKLAQAIDDTLQDLYGQRMGFALFMFPFDGMPRPAQWIAEMLPMTHFMRLIRGVVLRGATLAELSNEVAILVGFIVVAMTIAVLRFNKTLD